jgi:hypothetical protein
MASTITSIGTFKTFNKNTDTRRDIHLSGKKITDISMIPTDITWDTIVLDNTLVRKIPSDLSCNKLVIDDNPFIKSVETVATDIVIIKCYSLKKIVAPNCISLNIALSPAINSIPVNEYSLLQITGNENTEMIVPNLKGIVSKSIRFENAVISCDVRALKNVFIEGCTLTKQNTKINSGDNIYIYSSNANNIIVDCNSFTIGNCFISNISKKSSFKNFKSTTSVRKCNFSYDFLIGRTLNSCIIEDDRKNKHFPENITIKQKIVSFGLIPPKKITIEEYSNIRFDDNWDMIYNTKKVNTYGNMTISAICAKTLSGITSIGDVNIYNNSDSVLHISLNTLICSSLNIEGKIKLDLPKNYIVGNIIYNIATFDIVPKSVNWGDCVIDIFKYTDEYDIPLENFPIPGVKGFTICDGILSFYTHKKNIDRRTCYACSMSHCYNKYVIKDTLSSDRKIFAHGLTFKDAISSIERKKDSYFRYDTDIKAQYSKIPKDMPLEKDFCIKMYRDLTGACSGGVSMFLSRFKELNKTYNINDIVEMTKGEYGHQRFVDAFK